MRAAPAGQGGVSPVVVMLISVVARILRGAHHDAHHPPAPRAPAASPTRSHQLLCRSAAPTMPTPNPHHRLIADHHHRKPRPDGGFWHLHGPSPAAGRCSARRRAMSLKSWMTPAMAPTTAPKDRKYLYRVITHGTAPQMPTNSRQQPQHLFVRTRQTSHQSTPLRPGNLRLLRRKKAAGVTAIGASALASLSYHQCCA